MQTWYSHEVIHHHSTFRNNQVIQFSNPGEEALLRGKLIANGHAHVLEHDYGLRVGSLRLFIRYIFPTIPLVVMGCMLFGQWFGFSAIIFLIIMPLMSEYVHPLLHMPYEEAYEHAPIVLKPLVKTEYFRFLARYHWLHHENPAANFNLLLGGDYLFGTYRTATSVELVEMARIGLHVPVPRQPS